MNAHPRRVLLADTVVPPAGNEGPKDELGLHTVSRLLGRDERRIGAFTIDDLRQWPPPPPGAT
jgi:hypothetical protein